MKILRKTDIIYLKRKLRTCRIQIQVEIVWFFGKETKNFIFSIFFPKGGPFGVETVKMVFFNFSKFHNFFSQNSFTGTKQILKQTKSWILVTPVIKLWKCQTVLGCSGPKGPPSVGIGLSISTSNTWQILNGASEILCLVNTYQIEYSF